jgi:ribosomal protein S18 acetylase RimI-like enzyme
MNSIEYQIRELKREEFGVLEVFLYEAIFQKEGEPLLPRSIIQKPELKVYIDEFGKKDDYCFIAEVGGEIIGAVWVRIIMGEIKGYGRIGDDTPELAISILKPYRNLEIGTALMKTMLEHLRTKGYGKISLSVSKENHAYQMYEKLGFEIVSEPEDDYLMVLDLI